MLQIKIEVNKADLEKIKQMPNEFRAGLKNGVRKAMIFAEGKAKQDFTKSRGPAGGLHVRSGHLRRGIESGIIDHGDIIEGWLGDNIIYAPIHENSAIIYPKKGPYLRFPIDGHWVSVKKVIIPKRPFLRPVIEENINEIAEIIHDTIIAEVDK